MLVISACLESEPLRLSRLLSPTLLLISLATPTRDFSTLRADLEGLLAAHFGGQKKTEAL